MHAKSVVAYKFAIILIMAFLVFVGCSQDEKSNDSQKDSLTVGLILAVGGLGDNSVNDSAFAGLNRAKNELSITTRYLEPREAAEFEEHLRVFAENETKLVIGVGSSMKSPIEKIAKSYPKTIFAIIDVKAEGENVLSLVFRENEGAFLAGQLAALTSKTKKVGFIGGMDIPLLRKWQKGYEEGAKSINDSIIIDSRYLDVTVKGFSNPVKGKAVAQSMYSSGSDVILQVTGGSATGIYRAAKEQGKFVIGSDQNQDSMAPGFILTSVVRDVEQVVYNTIKKMKNEKIKGGEISFGLKEGGIHLTDFSLSKEKIPPEAISIIEDTKQQIIDGKIKVTDVTE